MDPGFIYDEVVEKNLPADTFLSLPLALSCVPFFQLQGRYFSLPGIGEYRVPIIFVNKKSKNPIKNLNHSITTLLVFAPGALQPYFSLGKNQR